MKHLLQKVDGKLQSPLLHYLFMKIPEPRLVRILYFGMYVSLLVAGVLVFLSPPSKFQSVLGLTLVYVLALFVTLGGLLASLTVLPGIWWLERVGLWSLGTGMGMYIVIVITLGSSFIGIATSFGFLMAFVIRWASIREFQLAPRIVPPAAKE